MNLKIWFHQNPPAFVPLRMRRTTLGGSRYLAHDLTDLPVPSEEWNIGKKRFKFHRNAVRSSSLQPQRQPPPVLRQSSTPTILESQYAVPRYASEILMDRFLFFFLHKYKNQFILEKGITLLTTDNETAFSGKYFLARESNSYF